VFNKGGKNRHWTKEWYKHRPQYTHEDLMTDLILNEPNNYKIFCDWMFHHLMSYSRLFPLQSLKEVHAMSSHSSQLLFITLRYLDKGNIFEDLKFMSATSPQSTGIIITSLFLTMAVYRFLHTLL
jgi:hypothetical protein